MATTPPQGNPQLLAATPIQVELEVTLAPRDGRRPMGARQPSLTFSEMGGDPALTGSTTTPQTNTTPQKGGGAAQCAMQHGGGGNSSVLLAATMDGGSEAPPIASAVFAESLWSFETSGQGRPAMLQSQHDHAKSSLSSGVFPTSHVTSSATPTLPTRVPSNTNIAWERRHSSDSHGSSGGKQPSGDPSGNLLLHTNSTTTPESVSRATSLLSSNSRSRSKLRAKVSSGNLMRSKSIAVSSDVVGGASLTGYVGGDVSPGIARLNSQLGSTSPQTGGGGGLAPYQSPQQTPSTGSLQLHALEQHLRRGGGGGGTGGGGGDDDAQQQRPAIPSPSSMARDNATPPPLKGAPRRLEVLSDHERSRMQAVFDRYDTKRTGSIESTSLVKLLGEIGHPMPSSQAMELLRQVDANKNGLMEFDELLQLVLIFKGVAQFRIAAPSSSGANKGNPKGFFSGSRGSRAGSVFTSGGGGYQESADEEDEAYLAVFSTQYHISKTMEKFRAILPDASLWKWAWDVAMLVLYMYIFCSVVALHMRHASAEVWEQGNYFFYPDILITLVLAVQMAMSCFTSYQGVDGTWVQDYQLITHRYLRSSFFLDAVSLLPLRCFVAEDLDNTVAMMVLAHFRLLRLPRALELFSCSNQVGMTRQYIGFFFVFAPLAMQIAALLCAIHLYAVIWIRILDDDNTLYGTGVYITMYYFSGVGYGGYEQNTLGSQWWSNICTLSALFINAAVVGSVVNLMSQADVEGSRQSRLVETQAVLVFFDVPKPLQEEILQFQNHVLTKDIQSSHRGLMDSLPIEIQANLQMQLQFHVLDGVRLFRDAHDTVKIALVQLFSNIICCPEEYLVVSGEDATDIIFINYGFIDLVDCNGVYVTTLRNGHSFADALMFAPRDVPVVHEMSAKSLGYSELLVLGIEGLWEVMKMFPTFSGDIADVGRKRKIGAWAPLMTPEEIPVTASCVFEPEGGGRRGSRVQMLNEDDEPEADDAAETHANLAVIETEAKPSQQRQQTSGGGSPPAPAHPPHRRPSNADSLHGGGSGGGVSTQGSPRGRRRSGLLRPFQVSETGEVAFLLGVDSILEEGDEGVMSMPRITSTALFAKQMASQMASSQPLGGGRKAAADGGPRRGTATFVGPGANPGSVDLTSGAVSSPHGALFLGAGGKGSQGKLTTQRRLTGIATVAETGEEDDDDAAVAEAEGGGDAHGFGAPAAPTSGVDALIVSNVTSPKGAMAMRRQQTSDGLGTSSRGIAINPATPTTSTGGGGGKPPLVAWNSDVQQSQAHAAPQSHLAHVPSHHQNHTLSPVPQQGLDHTQQQQLHQRRVSNNNSTDIQWLQQHTLPPAAAILHAPVTPRSAALHAMSEDDAWGTQLEEELAQLVRLVDAASAALAPPSSASSSSSAS